MIRRNPRARAKVDRGLDSLLDTMTNVVGILIVILAVTQMTVTGALQRIRALAEAGAENRIEAPAAPTETPRDLLSVEGEASLLAGELERARGLRPLRDEDDTSVERERAQLARRAEALRVAIRKERRALDEVQVRLESTVAALPVRAVRLPDPRTAPAGSAQIAIFCRYARCFPVDRRQLLGSRRRGIQAAVGMPEALVSEPTDWRTISEYFDRHDFGDDNLRMRIDTRGIWSLEWRDSRRGESLRELRASSSRMRRLLDSASPADSFLTYFVWADSFEAYLGARELSEAAKIPAGWIPLETRFTFSQNVVNPPTNPTPID